MQMQVTYYTEQLMSFEYQSGDQSEMMHNIIFAYKTTKILDNKLMSIASEGL